MNYVLLRRVPLHLNLALPARPASTAPRPALKRSPIRLSRRIDLGNLVVDMPRVAAGKAAPGDVVEHDGRLPAREGPVPCD